MPSDAIYVGRPTRWGNPFTLDDWRGAFLAVSMGFPGDREGRRKAAVELYRLWVLGQWRTCLTDERTPWQREVLTVHASLPPTVAAIREHLRGRNLVCWCPLNGPCHADVLLEIANDARSAA